MAHRMDEKPDAPSQLLKVFRSLPVVVDEHRTCCQPRQHPHRTGHYCKVIYSITPSHYKKQVSSRRSKSNHHIASIENTTQFERLPPGTPSLPDQHVGYRIYRGTLLRSSERYDTYVPGYITYFTTRCMLKAKTSGTLTPPHPPHPAGLTRVVHISYLTKSRTV